MNVSPHVLAQCICEFMCMCVGMNVLVIYTWVGVGGSVCESICKYEG